MSNYLRNRPFMVITYTYVLAAGQKSNTKGFGAEAQWEPIENMVIVDRLSNKDLTRAELVLDLLEGKVIKCRDNSLDTSKLFGIFVKRHFDEIKTSLLNWIQKDPSNHQKIKDFVDAHNDSTAS